MKKRVFISGVTGTMGKSGLDFLMRHLEQLEIITLVRPSKKNRKIMKQYADKITIIWGDLTVYGDVIRAIDNVDYILHVAALVSPEADLKPDLAYKINVGSIENILQAIKELELLNVKIVNIGTVAETGDRLPPIHWGRVGDPLKPSIYDHYAKSKIKAERLVIESGLKYWVSLRQTGILHYGLLNMMEGIMFHQPLNNVLEWVSEKDAGRLLANICIKDLPDEFYRKVYNVGGGKSCRINNYDFMSKMFNLLGIKDIQKIFGPSWFATKNFHGQYYLDSDVLNDYLDFQTESIDDFLLRLKDNLPPITLAMKYLPSNIIKEAIMKPICKSKSGPLYWKRQNDLDKINAYFGSKESWNQIKTYNDLDLNIDYNKVEPIYHGYNEKKTNLEFNDIRFAANFRGGKCLSKATDFSDIDSKLAWSCTFKHKFTASVRLVLKTGHWCPECEGDFANYENIAKKNPFFEQVYNK